MTAVPLTTPASRSVDAPSHPSYRRRPGRIPWSVGRSSPRVSLHTDALIV